jgi:L-alanine-DL-glutamate epimerase-like enolase superfamily enzyme
VNGQIEVPQGSGLGVDVRDDVLRDVVTSRRSVTR